AAPRAFHIRATRPADTGAPDAGSSMCVFWPLAPGNWAGRKEILTDRVNSRALPPRGCRFAHFWWPRTRRQEAEMKKKIRYLIIAVLLFATFAWLNNTDVFMDVPDGQRPVLLAHRGLAQTYTRENLERDTCTATLIYQPNHPFLENTLPSMAAAFAAGADVVELDVHPT